MDKKICLDTDVCIAILRDEPRAVGLREKIKESEVYVSVITMFELLLRKTNLQVIDEFLAHVHHIPIDDGVSRKASTLHKELAKKGELIDIRDLFIAAACLTNNIDLLTYNRNHFERIKDLHCL